MEDDYLLTTLDNPWNPHTNFDEWNQWDMSHGYYTLSYIGRLIDQQLGNNYDEISFRRAALLVYQEILDNNVDAVYAKVYEGEECPLA